MFLSNPTGVYYYVDGADGTNTLNNHALLISPLFTQAGTDCVVSVWYYIYGNDFGNLEIKRRLGADDRTLMVINRGNAIISQWTQATIPLSPCLANFYVRKHGNFIICLMHT